MASFLLLALFVAVTFPPGAAAQSYSRLEEEWLKDFLSEGGIQLSREETEYLEKYGLNDKTRTLQGKPPDLTSMFEDDVAKDKIVQMLVARLAKVYSEMENAGLYLDEPGKRAEWNRLELLRAEFSEHLRIRRAEIQEPLRKSAIALLDSNRSEDQPNKKLLLKKIDQIADAQAGADAQLKPHFQELARATKYMALLRIIAADPNSLPEMKEYVAIRDNLLKKIEARKEEVIPAIRKKLLENLRKPISQG